VTGASPRPYIEDAPGRTLAERIGFTAGWFKARARTCLDLSNTYRLAGNKRAAAAQLGFAASWRRDAAAISHTGE
jgi:hypothetical protein